MLQDNFFERVKRMLTKAQILQADDLPTEVVEVPEWGGSVTVRTLTGTERDAFEESITKRRGDSVEVNMINLRAKLCAMTMIDDDGERYFSDADVAELGKKSANVLDRIFAVAQRLNGFGQDDIKELAKNSEAAQSGDSTSS